jgi:uncharacterized cupin superfamily protein
LVARDCLTVEGGRDRCLARAVRTRLLKVLVDMQDRVENFPAKASADLKPAPFPNEWVRQGSPRASAKRLWKSDDHTATTLVWECTAGTFDWYYREEETLHIIQGYVEILLDDGRKLALGPGDTAIFKSGSHAVWTVPDRVRKVAICRWSVPAGITLPMRVWRKAKSVALAALGQRDRSSLIDPAAAKS